MQISAIVDEEAGFAQVAGGIIQNVEAGVRASMKDFVVRLVDELVDNTPKKTGNARANWQTALNGAKTNYLAPNGSSPARGESDAKSEAEETMTGYQTGDVVSITNNTPYIGQLNSGSSKQAPAAFVETALLNVHAQFNLGIGGE